MENKEKNLIIGLDVSTTTIGCSIFEDNGDSGTLKMLTHITPKPPKEFGNDLFLKAKAFEVEFIEKFKNDDILPFSRVKAVVIEEPLLRSNNVNTVGTLLRFNGMISYIIFKHLGIKPNYISSYDARYYGFPELIVLQTRKKDGTLYTEKELSKREPTLFGGFVDVVNQTLYSELCDDMKRYYHKEKDKYKLDKKIVLWELVNRDFEGINWAKNKKGELAKECFDQSDSITATLGFMRKNGFWK